MATTAAALALSKQKTGRAASALNSVSHIAWGRAAYGADHFDVKHTLVGSVLSAGSMLPWATLQLMLPNARSGAAILAKGAVVSALAYIIDLHVVPKRFTPGFEHRLSPEAVGAMYAVLALSLAAGDWLGRHGYPNRRSWTRAR